MANEINTNRDKAKESHLCQCLECGAFKETTELYRLTTGNYVCTKVCLGMYLDANDTPVQYIQPRSLVA